MDSPDNGRRYSCKTAALLLSCGLGLWCGTKQISCVPTVDPFKDESQAEAGGDSIAGSLAGEPVQSGAFAGTKSVEKG
jgi:hypothetical protein